MKIESVTVEVQSDQENIFQFLTDSNNILHLLPQDKITDWQASSTECSFKVQGGVIISLLQDGNQGLDKVFMKSGPNSPFPFRLTLNIMKEENCVKGNIQFDGEVSMFLKLIVEKPLTNLFNHMSEKLKEQFSH